jgi:hypothetical protein
LEAEGKIEQTEPGVFRLSTRVTRRERLWSAAYLRWSLVRATARWPKHVFTFDDWLEFILRKARRHTGQDIVLTIREQRMPLVFLWPRVFRYLRDKNAQGAPQA